VGVKRLLVVKEAVVLGEVVVVLAQSLVVVQLQKEKPQKQKLLRQLILLMKSNF
jgi:hypothetical protein